MSYMAQTEIRTEQPIAAKKKRGAGRPFTRNDPRINKGGIPSEIRDFHKWMRECFAVVLQEQSQEGLTNGEHIIRALIQRAKEGDMKAIEYVLDRMGGRPTQAVELSGSIAHTLTDADRQQAEQTIQKLLSGAKVIDVEDLQGQQPPQSTSVAAGI